MARYETTIGDLVITLEQCECGSTGGCEKCQPITIKRIEALDATEIASRLHQKPQDKPLDADVQFFYAGGRWHAGRLDKLSLK